ncbi:MAG: ATP-binding cassette domain-containing protein [Spirochaetales bacterium]|nr:ATP-binding cassette domain-containing protein [Spirochaetales bacterium]
MMKTSILQKTAGIAAVLALWTGASFIIGDGLIPAPWQICIAAGGLLLNTDAMLHVVTTVLRVTAAFVAALFAGTILGIARGIHPFIESTTSPFISFFQGIPPILWAIPLLFITGFIPVSPVIVITLIILPLIAVNVTEGVKAIPGEYYEMLRVFSSRKKLHIRNLVIPVLFPYLSSSIRLGLILGIKGSVAAEYFTANNGIGFMINTAGYSADIPLLFTWGLIILFLIFIFNRLLDGLFTLFSFNKKRIRDVEKSLLFIPDIREKRITDEILPLRPVELKNLSFSWHSRHGKPDGILLEKIGLTVREKTTAVISGDSGIGKTTLLKIIAGILHADAGTCTKQLSSSFLFQDDRLLPWYSVIHNVALPLLENGIPREPAYRKAVELLKQVGLQNAMLAFPDELSGGMKRRACLARCFAARNDCILLDEPFNGLHKKARKQLFTVFMELWKIHPCPVVVATHFPEELPADRIFRHYTLSGNPATLKKTFV